MDTKEEKRLLKLVTDLTKMLDTKRKKDKCTNADIELALLYIVFASVEKKRGTDRMANLIIQTLNSYCVATRGGKI